MSAASSSAGADWEFQPFDPGSTAFVEQECAVRFEEFIEQNNQQLRELEEALAPTLSSSCNPDAEPIGFDLSPYEASSLIELVKTDNKLFDKLMLVFASLILEMKKLARLARTRYATPFLLFGMERPPSAADASSSSSSSAASSSSASAAPAATGEYSQEGEAQLQIGRMLEFVVEFSAYLNRCYVVTRNVIRQLASLYHQEQTMYKQSFQYFHLDSVWSALGELFVALMLLDEVLRANETFAQCWAMYKRMTQAIRTDATRYAVQEDDVLKFEKLFGQLEGVLFEGLVFFNAVNQEFDFPGIVSVRKNAVFRNEFLNYIKAEIVLLSTRVPAPEARAVQPLPQRYMALCGLFACYFAVFKASTDKKLFQTIWDLYKLFPVVHLTADCVWLSTDFLSKKVLLAHHLPAEDISGFRVDFLKRWQARFPVEVQTLSMETGVWMVQIESNLSNRAELVQIIDARRALLTEGVRLAQKINELFNLYVVLHSKLRRAVRPTDVPLLWKLVELLKGIQLTFMRKSATVAETLAFIQLRLGLALQTAFVPVKKKLSTLDQKQLSPARLDALAAVGCALAMLNSGGSESRRAVLNVCTHIIFPISGWKEVEIDEVKLLLDRLHFVAGFQDTLQRVCNTSFLFWNYTNFLPFYWTALKLRPVEALKLPLLFAAFRDVDRLLAGALHESPERMRKDFQDEIRQEFVANVVVHLQRAIETDLRFHVHCHLGVENRDPFKNGVLNLRPFLDLPPLRLFEQQAISLRDEITRYLDVTFYNLNTVQLSDWKTYGEMRNLAKEKYGLELADAHLPGQTLEQGLDVLEIMRNIHVFVARFAYNINNQVFIERQSDSKFLHSINIQHIANSIRTHGTGITNTAVNLIFQFLKRKFNIFSQFLFDDYIKSHLYRDVKFFKDHRTELENMYSYERAELFNKEIRKLGLNAKNESYMDQFRGLVTEIGNAMGYVRMIRSASMLYTGNAIKFVPDLKSIPKFAQLAADAALPPPTLEAATNLDATLETLSKNFAEGTDYFKHLVGVFCRQFRDPKNLHLHSFYSIVPPLTINFVEHSMQMKEKLAKKKAYSGGIHEGSGFTDDGFAMGLAYILKLLDQNTAFNSLHWFDAVNARYQRELQKVEIATRKAVEDERAKSKGRRSATDTRESEISQSLVLTAKKLNTNLQEFQLLRYSFEGARIFFKE